MTKSNSFHDCVALFVLLAIGLLHPFAWSEHPPDVDPINFTMALHHFDPGADSPHPPGYPLYVGLGRVAALLAGSNHAYQLVNLLTFLATGFCLYAICRRFERADIGVAALLLWLTHPLAWAATVVPESYITDAFFAVSIVALFVCLSGRTILLLGSFLLFFAIGLVRPVSCALLLPMVVGLAAMPLSRQDSQTPWGWATLVGTAAIMGGGLGYLLTMCLAGGPEHYLRAAQRVMGGSVKGVSVFAGAPVRAHLQMLIKLVVWCLVLSTPLVLASAILRPWKTAVWQHQLPTTFFVKLTLALWILPPLAFYALVYFLKPTYLLIILPALLLMTAWALSSSTRLVLPIAAGMLSAFQLGFFWFAPAGIAEPLHRLTQAYVTVQDNAWNELLAELPKANSQDDLLLWVGHPKLTPYALRLLPWAGSIAVADSKWQTITYLKPESMTWSEQSVRDVPAGVKRLVLVTPNGIREQILSQPDTEGRSVEILLGTPH